MFWFLFSGVYLFCVSHGQLEYFDDSDYDGLKLDLEPSSDMDYFSGVFGERQDPDGKFIYIFFFSLSYKFATFIPLSVSVFLTVMDAISYVLLPMLLCKGIVLYWYSGNTRTLVTFEGRDFSLSFFFFFCPCYQISCL